jgi:hypothetical protein
MAFCQLQPATLLDEDFDYWLNLPFWSPETGIPLMLGKDPRTLNWNVLRHLTGFNDLADEFDRAYSLFYKDYKAGFIRGSSPPEVFVAWAMDAGLDMPRPLRGFAQRTVKLRQYFRQLDYRTTVDTEQVNADPDLGRSQSQPVSDLEIEQGIRSKVTHAMSRKVAEVSSIESPSPVVETPLSTKERATTFKMILGMAMGGYAYKPGASRNGATSDIANDVHAIGLQIDEDTVRKYLREAAETLLPADQMSSQ